MLVIRRHPGEAIQIGDDVEILVIDCGCGRVKLGIRAPQHVAVMRGEVRLTREQNLAAARTLKTGAYFGRQVDFQGFAVQASVKETDT